MDVTPQNLRAIYTSLSTSFNQRLRATTTLYGRVAMDVNSTSSKNEYPRLDDLPGFREWVGDRHVHDLSEMTYAIQNKSFEKTIGIDRDKIEDDEIGIFTPVVQQFGQDTALFPDLLVFDLMKRANQVVCYDSQYFFDTDHPSYNDQGREISVSNFQAGAGPAWYLIDDSQVIKPFIYQKRRPFTFVSRTALTDDNVFNAKKFVYGVDGRCNVGVGMWQTAFMSKAALTPDNYAAARAAMTSIRRRDGAPLAIAPRILVVPPALEGAARALMANDMISKDVGGTPVAVSNEWKGTAEVLVVPYLG
ncbi:Mu-like prophage major head subunit gpT family protein [Microvirga terricola]|uniref:Bacteriophage Mu GpT domain-containing protein n=1 Tax=Microvirga terricola TaxID=2719797 RepID=A0ABX0VAH3_9HYPH|nr:Mu-like prophage major head subunit gpT family protein [Microvirga terricola]NIX75391.1 hypothetical protein [Microvirga terricola]